MFGTYPFPLTDGSIYGLTIGQLDNREYITGTWNESGSSFINCKRDISRTDPTQNSGTGKVHNAGEIITQTNYPVIGEIAAAAEAAEEGGSNVDLAGSKQ